MPSIDSERPNVDLFMRQTRMTSSFGSDVKLMKYILTNCNQPQISEAELDRLDVDPNSFRHA